MSAGVNAIGFHTHACEFFEAAEAVHATPGMSPLPLAFLWSRTIELLLKSYLLSVGVRVEELRARKFGHNLVALHREASSRGLDALIGTQPTDSGLIRFLNIDYGPKRFEYRDTSEPYHLPDSELTRTLIRRLIRGIKHHLVRNGI